MEVTIYRSQNPPVPPQRVRGVSPWETTDMEGHQGGQTVVLPSFPQLVVDDQLFDELPFSGSHMADLFSHATIPL